MATGPGRQGTLQATGSSVISTRRNSEPNPKADAAQGLAYRKVVCAQKLTTAKLAAENQVCIIGPKPDEPPPTGGEWTKAATEGLMKLGTEHIPKHRPGWNWCMGGRQALRGPAALKAPEEKYPLARSLVEPEGVPRRTLDGRQADAGIFGEDRNFGQDGGWNGRMRGGVLAENGWHGTFPSNHPRGPGWG